MCCEQFSKWYSNDDLCNLSAIRPIKSGNGVLSESGVELLLSLPRLKDRFWVSTQFYDLKLI